jgi:hypothetical protein
MPWAGMCSTFSAKSLSYTSLSLPHSFCFIKTNSLVEGSQLADMSYTNLFFAKYRYGFLSMRHIICVTAVYQAIGVENP